MARANLEHGKCSAVLSERLFTQVLVDRHAVLSGVSYVAVLSKAFVLVIL